MDRFRRLGSGVVAVSVITVLVTVVGAGVKFTMVLPVVSWLI